MNLNISRRSRYSIAQPRKPIDTRMLSSRQRVRQIRRLPSLDTRSLLADPNLEYSQPAYIQQEKLRLMQEVDSLRNEVYPMREHCRLIQSSFDDGEEAFSEVRQNEISNRLTDVQAELDELEQSLSYYKNVLTDDTENELNNTIGAQRQMMSQINEQQRAMTEDIGNKRERLADVTSGENVDKIDKNNDKIQSLQEMLKEMKDEEKEMMEKHEKMCNLEPSNIESSKEINALMRKLQLLEHSHARKLVDMRKLQKDLQTQKDTLAYIKQNKEENERKRQELYAWNKRIKERERLNEENSRMMSELSRKMSESDASSVCTNGTSSTYRRKHKRKHWHHHRENTESEIPPENSEFKEHESDPIIEFDDTPIGVVERINNNKQPKPPITFKTEIEKTDSLHIGKDK